MNAHDTPITFYQTDDGQISLEVRLDAETVWLRQDQMGVFGRERSVITKHLRNVFAEGELDEKSNVQILHIANSDGRQCVGVIHVGAIVGATRYKKYDGITI